ncbi:fasciclin domain-containing protein [Niabella beijingensis]|uniref:fasciclin domain-containing protein n=1 Tax=Niabella beijingensis TaxID=2872700 RepID=UPI001CC119BB|nr:fasciclin domain-containing protein [Niabella beijingensis]MBZ4190886.1 fasciclin domain-containing protein [Niabella beijingensis]
MNPVPVKQFLYLCLIAVFFTSCTKKGSYETVPGAVNLYQVITDDKASFSVFKYAVDQAGMAEELKSGNYALFAPTNAAFSGAGITTAMLYNMPRDSVVWLVKNHLLPGNTDIMVQNNGQILNAASGFPLLVQKTGDNVYLNGGDVMRSNIKVTNGSLNVINTLLFSRSSIFERLNAYNGAPFSVLIAAIIKASEGSTNYRVLLSDPEAAYTLFAPTNAAFTDAGLANVAAVQALSADSLSKILSYHLLEHRKLMPDFAIRTPLAALNGVPVYFDVYRTNPWLGSMGYAEGVLLGGGASNMTAGRGVIHSVGRLLPKPIVMNSLQRIQSDTSLSYFYAAVEAAGTTGGINFSGLLTQNDSSYTVFALNNNGFRLAGYPTTESLKAATPETLSRILRYSFVNGRINNISVSSNSTVPTLLSAVNPADGNLRYTPVTVFYSGTGVSSTGYAVQGGSNSNGINVLSRNIVTTNGIVNIIGQMLLP